MSWYTEWSFHINLLLNVCLSRQFLLREWLQQPAKPQHNSSPVTSLTFSRISTSVSNTTAERNHSAQVTNLKTAILQDLFTYHKQKKTLVQTKSRASLLTGSKELYKSQDGRSVRADVITHKNQVIQNGREPERSRAKTQSKREQPIRHDLITNQTAETEPNLTCCKLSSFCSLL